MNLKSTMRIVSAAAFLFILAGTLSNLMAQGNPTWVPKASKNGVNISVAVINACHGSDIMLYRVQNDSNNSTEVEFTVDYNVNATVINDSKLVIINANTTFVPTCDEAAMGMSSLFSVIPQNASIDISQVTIEIQ